MYPRIALPAVLVAVASCGRGTDATDNGNDDSGMRDVASGDDANSPTDGSGNEAGMAQAASVTQFHNHINRDGFFIDAAITKTTAATFHRDTTFSGAVRGNVYASPLYVENGPGGKGAFYMVTENDDVYALDETTGNAVWHKSVGTAAANTGAGCGNISPIGITGTPAIDLTTRVMVFSAVTATTGGDIATHTVYGLSIDDGSEKWKVDVSTLRDSTGLAFSPQPQNQRGAVLIVNGTAYVVFGGHYGDCGSYHGWVIAVPVATGKNPSAWATMTRGAGIWACGGAASDGTSVFVTTGNAIGGPQTWAESEGVLRLDTSLSFTNQNADFFTPSDWKSLDQNDVDLSGSGPLVIDAPSMTPSKLVMAQGKDGNLYLIDRTDMGGVGATPLGQLNVLSGEISNAGAWANVGGVTYVVIRPNSGGSGVNCPNNTSGDLVTVKLDPNAPQKMTVAWCANAQGEGSPIITTSDGNNDALVWTAGAEASNALHAWDLQTGKLIFSGGKAADKIPNVRHFTSPIVARGRIFVGGDNVLYALKP